MKKLPDWVQRFEGVLARRKNDPFDWGTHNCCTLTKELIEATTGVDVMEGITLSETATEHRAYGAMRRFTRGGIDAAAEKVAARLGFDEIPPLTAQRGDPVIVEWDGVRLLAVVGLDGRFIIAITPADGLIDVPVEAAVRAWKVT